MKILTIKILIKVVIILLMNNFLVEAKFLKMVGGLQRNRNKL